MVVPTFDGPLNQHSVVLFASKQHWPTVTCLPGVLPIALHVSESPDARHTSMYCDCYKLATARFNVGSSSEELMAVLYSYAQAGLPISHRRGQGSLNCGASIDATETQLAMEKMYVLWF
jgi:hypothetical protein